MRIILLIVAAGILCGSVVAVLGYLMYRDALKEQNLEDKVAEVQADPSYTPLADLPEIYLDAVVAVEDHRFEQHCGVDIIAIARAAWNNIKSWSLREGGSTITQQLARTCILPRSGVLSVRLRRFSWPFGWSRPTQRTRSWAVCQLHLLWRRLLLCRDASAGYFGKEPADMADDEATLLAGIPNAPSVYSLTANPDLAAQRQQYVLQQMVKYGYLGEEEAAGILQN